MCYDLCRDMRVNTNKPSVNSKTPGQGVNQDRIERNEFDLPENSIEGNEFDPYEEHPNSHPLISI